MAGRAYEACWSSATAGDAEVNLTWTNPSDWDFDGVLFHGGYGSWIHWIRNIGFFKEHFTVYAADSPGLGDSDPPPEDRSPCGDSDYLLRPRRAVAVAGQYPLG